MLCRLLSISDSVAQSPCRFRGRRLAVQSIFMDLFMSPVSHFRIPRFSHSHSGNWQLAKEATYSTVEAKTTRRTTSTGTRGEKGRWQSDTGPARTSHAVWSLTSRYVPHWRKIAQEQAAIDQHWTALNSNCDSLLPHRVWATNNGSDTSTAVNCPDLQLMAYSQQDFLLTYQQSR